MMDNLTCLADIEHMNFLYLLLVRSMATELAVIQCGLPKATVEHIKLLSIEEIKSLAHDMPTPCFRLPPASIEMIEKVSPLNRRGFFLNVAMGDAK